MSSVNLLEISGLSSAGPISMGVGTMLGLSTSTDLQGSPGSLPGSGNGPRREPSTSGGTSSLPGGLRSHVESAI